MCMRARVYVLMRDMFLMYGCMGAGMNIRGEIGGRRGQGGGTSERARERERKRVKLE